MNPSIRPPISVACATLVGLAVSSGLPPQMCLAVVFPVLSMVQFRRGHSYKAAFGYYAGASWPVVVVTQNYLGGTSGAVKGVFLWLLASTLLSLPWFWAWSSNRPSAVWRAPLALLASVVPPLGIIGWAHPLMATGYLFPGTKWFGVVTMLLLPGVFVAFPRPAIGIALTASVVANLLFPNVPPPPTGWKAMNTNFGNVATSPLTEYAAAQWIQARALSLSERVLIFPESVVPNWNEATELFWAPTLNALHNAGRTIVFGGTIFSPERLAIPSGIDFAAQLRTLIGQHQTYADAKSPKIPYRNVVLARGAESAELDQRIPVPLAMWNPFRANSVGIRTAGTGTIQVEGQRVAVLICYEQLITWPILISLTQNPTVLAVVANDVWTKASAINRIQHSCSLSWARAFGLRSLSATND